MGVKQIVLGLLGFAVLVGAIVALVIFWDDVTGAIPSQTGCNVTHPDISLVACGVDECKDEHDLYSQATLYNQALAGDEKVAHCLGSLCNLFQDFIDCSCLSCEECGPVCNQTKDQRCALLNCGELSA